ncbi:MAG TPA: Zn-dependent hydrolase [Terriglobia bacterium]|nr:Zn-dependent hydrolase [Terriglobia bacterium]
MRRYIQVGVAILFAGFFMACSRPNNSSVGKPPQFGVVAPDLASRLAKWRWVKMPYDDSGLTNEQRQVVEKLVDACRYLDDIFWRQSDPDALDLYESLEDKKDPADIALRRFLMINGSRFDLLDDNKPFVGTRLMPPGHWLYPRDLTRAEIDAYLKTNPSIKTEIYSPYSIVRREDRDLAAIPYNVAYKPFLEKAAADLRKAAALSDDKMFAKFLTARAAALLDDNYYPSDVQWLDLKNPKIDVIFAPYETYLDGLLGVKTSYGAAVLIRNDAESKKLALYEKYIPMIQRDLPLPPADLPSLAGHRTPMEVVDSPFRAGDLKHGYQAIADNLPNDPRIHQTKGTKKIFFKNFMDARVNNVVLPLVKHLMEPPQAAQVTGDGFMAMVVMHEISHGLGPAFAKVKNRQVSIPEAMGPIYSALEESKADVVGMYGLKWLVGHHALPKSALGTSYASYVGGIFRTVRYGVGEAHGKAEIMEFNYLSEQKAITWSAEESRYHIDYQRIPDALAKLAKELLEIEATGDRSRAEAWFNRYDKMPPTLQSALAKCTDVPVDIDPVFSFPENVQ